MEQAATLGSAIIACTVINGRVGGWADGRVGVILLYRHLVSQNPSSMTMHMQYLSMFSMRRGAGVPLRYLPVYVRTFYQPSVVS